MKTMMRVSLLFLIAITAFALAACQPAANTNTNTNANTAPKAAAPTADSLMALDTKAWDAYKNKDSSFFSNYLDDKYVSFDNGKREGKAEALKGIAGHKCDFKSHTLSEPKITMAGADAAVLTYKATIDGTCVDDDGKTQKIPSAFTVASVFVRSGDTWKGAYHNEVPIMEAPKPAEGANSNKAAADKESAGAEKKEMPPPPPKDEKPASNSANTASSNSSANTSTSSDALTDAIMAVEKKGWEAWMKQDAKGLEETTSKDLAFVDITGKATFGQAAVIKEWTNGQCKVSSVNVSDGKASMINADVAILTFKGTATGTCGDMKLEPLWGTTVAIKEGNTWKAVYIFETPMMK